LRRISGAETDKFEFLCCDDLTVCNEKGDSALSANVNPLKQMSNTIVQCFEIVLKIQSLIIDVTEVKSSGIEISMK
jgi:hypothetical protein